MEEIFRFFSFDAHRVFRSNYWQCLLLKLSRTITCVLIILKPCRLVIMDVPGPPPSTGLDLNSAGFGYDADHDEFFDSLGNRVDSMDHLAGSQVGNIAEEEGDEEGEDHDGEEEEYEEYEEEDDEFDPTRTPKFTKK